MALTTELDSRLAEKAIERWSGERREAADAWLLNMGFAISGMTRWLNVRKISPRVGVFPSVARTGADEVRLRIKWRRANRGLRKLVARSLRLAKRRTWSEWTADPKW